MATSGCDRAEYRDMRPHGGKLSRADFGGLILSADGSHVNARAWELLIAMLVMQAAFGLVGLVAAPIYYAYFKEEFRAKGLV